MLADIGLMALVVGFILAVYATAVSAWGGWRQEWRWVESARRATLLTVPFLTISVVIVTYSLFVMDFYRPTWWMCPARRCRLS